MIVPLISTDVAWPLHPVTALFGSGICWTVENGNWSVNVSVFDFMGRLFEFAVCIRLKSLAHSTSENIGQAHRGGVNMLSWGHAEYGSLIATCGTDHEAKIWEEKTSSAAAASRWTAKAQLTEARKAVSCVEFAPRHWGLKLATGSADGFVRIYEAVDVLNLAQWTIAASMQCFTDGLGVTCLSWSTGRFEPPTLVVGGSHPAVYRYSDASRQWSPVLVLPPPPTGHVLDVAWAPNVGRRYHYIAAAEDKQLRIFKLTRGNGSGEGDNLELEATQTIPVSNAWRCQFNVTGTVLAVSGDRGMVQLWKSNYEGNFKVVAQVQGDLSEVAAQAS